MCLLTALPALAQTKEATISLGRDPEPPYCAIPGQTSVEIVWHIEHQTTPLRVNYYLQDPSRTIDLEQQVYPGSICVTKLADSNRNDQLDPGIDEPIRNWWICLTTPSGDVFCGQAGADGQVCWSGVPLGAYVIYEVGAAGWEPIGPESYTTVLVDGMSRYSTFLNHNRELCYRACCFTDGTCQILSLEECRAAQGA